jgi:hypothetical protein
MLHFVNQRCWRPFYELSDPPIFRREGAEWLAESDAVRSEITNPWLINATIWKMVAAPPDGPVKDETPQNTI